jgi:hypothetical protein
MVLSRYSRVFSRRYSHDITAKDNTMKTFLDKHAQNILGTLTCFDRLIFKGYLPLSSERGLEALFYHQDWRVKDFKVHAQDLSCRIADHAKALAASHGRPFLSLQGHHDKEQLARDLLRRQPVDQGLIVVLQTLESCRSFKVVPGPKRPHLKAATRKCRFFYFYFFDREFGLMHVRLQSWMPFPLQIYINGHSWLARKMERHGIGYHRIDNAFTGIEDLPRAQRFASRLAQKNWPRVLESFARRVNPLLTTVFSGDSHYWVCDQCELALDILFRDRASLAPLYKHLLEHATRGFGAEDVLTFFGRKLHGNFQGEVLTDYKVRIPGARIKHRLAGNWLKMYDKAGVILRIETVINQPRQFKVLRRGRRQGREVLGWFPMAKRVTNLPRYFEIGQAACQRYAQALAEVDDPRQAYERVHRLTRPCCRHGRRGRGLNPLRTEDAALFEAVLRGEHLIHGFRNRDIVRRLHPKGAASKAMAQRRSRRVTRRLSLLWVHGLIAKIPRSRRWRVTGEGRRLMSSTLVLRHVDIPAQLTAIPA